MNWPFLKKSQPAMEQAPIPTVHELQQGLAPQNSFGSWGGLGEDTWTDMLGGGYSAAGQAVNSQTAMRISTVFACVRLISSAASCSPIKIYRANGDRKENTAHPLAKMLLRRPNRFMTASTYWKASVAHKLLQGNMFSHIIRSRFGEAVALYPILPSRVTVYFAWELGLDDRLKVEKNRLFYGITYPDGTYKIIDQDDMLHVPNILSEDGKTGLSTIGAMRNAAGLALAAEESSSKFFANGMQFDKAITYPGKLDKESANRLREYWTNRHAGSANHHIPPILTEGGEIKQLTMSAEDAQLLESRKFSVVDICRFFGVHPVMIGETEKTSSWGSGVEQMGRWFSAYNMNEHFTAIEQELSVKLFGDDTHYPEFDESELSRGDLKARAEYFKAALGDMQRPGWMKVNEVRTAELLGTVGDGNTLQTPVAGSQPSGKGAANA